MSGTGKVCSVCGQVKPLDDFYCHSARCKPCTLAAGQAWRMTHPERVKELQRAERERMSPEQKARRGEHRRRYYAADPEKYAARSRRGRPAYERSRRDRRQATAESSWRRGRYQSWEDAALFAGGASVEVALRLGRSLLSIEARLDRLRNPERRTATARRVYQRRQTETEALARNKGKDWTGPELEVVADLSRSARDAALALGRTAAAVQLQRHKLKVDPRKINLAGVSR